MEVVVYEGTVGEKPSSEEEARQFIKGLTMLRPQISAFIVYGFAIIRMPITGYSGRSTATVSSVLVTNLKTGVRKGNWDRVEVRFIHYLIICFEVLSS